MAMTKYSLDPRSGQHLLRYHKKVRKNVPWAQSLVFLMIAPVLAFLSRLRIKGLKNIPDGGYIVVANHHSYYDPAFVSLAVRRRIRFMGKSELFTGKQGALLNALGGFPVRRGVWDEDAFDTAAAVVKRGRVMCMFPEGGIHPHPVPAKSGVGHIAHKAGATILPVYIKNARRMYKPWGLFSVKIIIGESYKIEEVEEPTREQAQQTAQQILDSVYALS
jgi:1-acyl-sn-glycerol-3-phosphate acyltransferase